MGGGQAGATVRGVIEGSVGAVTYLLAGILERLGNACPAPKEQVRKVGVQGRDNHRIGKIALASNFVELPVIPSEDPHIACATLHLAAPGCRANTHGNEGGGGLERYIDR